MVVAAAAKEGYYNLANQQRESSAMYVKSIELTIERLREAISYNPTTGDLIWKVDISKNVKAGTNAGCPKGGRPSKKTGKVIRYLYVKIDGYDITGARVAWAIQTGEWAETNVSFLDKDPSNLRFDNLSLARFPSIKSDHGERRIYKMSQEAQRHYGLRRYYGLSLQEYGEKLVAQNGVCAICEQPETAKIGGKLKPLSVDHSHADGKIRDLLCSSCNHMLGHAREKRETLIAAVRYLDKHSGASVPVVLKEVT